MKYELLDKTLIVRDHYVNDRSFRAARWLVDTLNTVIEKCNTGNYLLIDEHGPFEPIFKTDMYDGEFSGVSLKDSEDCTVQIIGDVTDEINGVWKIVATKKELKEYLKDWTLYELKSKIGVVNLV